MSNVSNAEVTAVITAEVVENSRNLNVLQTPTFQVITLIASGFSRSSLTCKLTNHLLQAYYFVPLIL